MTNHNGQHPRKPGVGRSGAQWLDVMVQELPRAHRPRFFTPAAVQERALRVQADVVMGWNAERQEWYAKAFTVMAIEGYDLDTVTFTREQAEFCRAVRVMVAEALGMEPMDRNSERRQVSRKIFGVEVPEKRHPVVRVVKQSQSCQRYPCGGLMVDHGDGDGLVCLLCGRGQGSQSPGCGNALGGPPGALAVPQGT